MLFGLFSPQFLCKVKRLVDFTLFYLHPMEQGNFSAGNLGPARSGARSVRIGRVDTPAEQVWKRLIFMGSF